MYRIVPKLEQLNEHVERHGFGLEIGKARADMGIILMPEEIIADELSSGKLRQIMPAWRGTPLPVYAMTESRLLPAKTQRFIEFLRGRLGQK